MDERRHLRLSDGRVLRYVESVRSTPPRDGYRGVFAWPSAAKLADYITTKAAASFHGRTVVELGCGVGIAGMAAAMAGAERVVLTDDGRSAGDELRLAALGVRLNALERVCDTARCAWGALDDAAVENARRWRPHIVLASDVLYRSADADDLLATVRLLLEQREGAYFLMMYEERSARRTIGRNKPRQDEEGGGVRRRAV